MSFEDFDRLLAKMPNVASVVNSFTAESVQQLAFSALMGELLGSGKKPAADSSAESENEHAASKSDNDKTPRRSKRPKSGAGTRDHVEAVKGLDLRPAGKKSFPDFIAEKTPGSNQDKFAVAVYWLEQIAEVSPVTVAHIAAVFKQTAGWREPGNLRVGLTTTATRKNTLDTSDLNNLRTTPHGRNFVEHDLPAGAGKG